MWVSVALNLVHSRGRGGGGGASAACLKYADSKGQILRLNSKRYSVYTYAIPMNEIN